MIPWQMWMVRCYSGETYSNGGRRNRMTRKIHPLESVRLTLNCDAGTLSLDVNGVDQGVVFSNVPPDVHPAVCFYGIAKSVRLVELKRIYGDSDSDADASDSEDEIDTEIAPTQDIPSSQRVHQASTPTSSGDIVAEACEVTTPTGLAQAPPERAEGSIDTDNLLPKSPNKASRRRAARREEAAVASTLRTATANGPSSGLLASLANLAQWYVPRGDQHGSMDHRPCLGEEDGSRMTRKPDAGITGLPSTSGEGAPVYDACIRAATKLDRQMWHVENVPAARARTRLAVINRPCAVMHTPFQQHLVLLVAAGVLPRVGSFRVLNQAGT